MDSNVYTVTMQGLSGGSSQHLFITMGFGSSEAGPMLGKLLLIGVG